MPEGQEHTVKVSHQISIKSAENISEKFIRVDDKDTEAE